LKPAYEAIEKEEIMGSSMVYSSPVKHITYLKSLPVNSTVRIFDMNGSMIKKHALSGKENSIARSHIAAGSYILTAISGGGGSFL
jgi:hypothetical protein